jgi:hypothetical protein
MNTDFERQEKTIVLFRKTSDGRIIALLTEIPYENNNMLWVGYEYIDKDTPSRRKGYRMGAPWSRRRKR